MAGFRLPRRREEWLGSSRFFGCIVNLAVMEKDSDPVLKALISLLVDKGILSPAELAERMSGSRGGLKLRPEDIPPTPLPLVGPLDEVVEGFERQLVEKALREAGGVKIRAAQILGVDKDRMKYLCRKYRIR